MRTVLSHDTNDKCWISIRTATYNVKKKVRVILTVFSKSALVDLKEYAKDSGNASFILRLYNNQVVKYVKKGYTIEVQED